MQSAFSTGVAFFLLGLMGSPSVWGGDPVGLPPELGAQLVETLDLVFQEDFKAADSSISKFIHEKENHVFVCSVDVIRHWWEMASQILETDEKAQKPFIDAVENCENRSENLYKKDENNKQALLTLATDLGLMSRWSAANHAWLASYFRGRKAAQYARKLIEQDNSVADAYMTLGAYNYGKEKVNEFLNDEEKKNIDQTDKETSFHGKKQLKTAYEDGTYFKKPAGILLAGILTNEDPENAVPIINKMRQDWSPSPFLHVIHLTALYNVNDLKTMDKEIKNFEDQINKKIYPGRYQPQKDFMKALTFMKKQEWNKAEEHFHLAAKSDYQNNAYRIWGELYRGYMLDLLDKREEAKAQYKKVLNLPRRFASHEHAKKRLETEFTSDAPEFKKLEL